MSAAMQARKSAQASTAACLVVLQEGAVVLGRHICGLQASSVVSQGTLRSAAAAGQANRLAQTCMK